MDTLTFISQVSWPMVALVAVLVLGPFGLLRSLIKDLAENAFKITDSVQQFKETVDGFHKTQLRLREDTAWVADLQSQLSAISAKLESVSANTQDLAISEGSRSLAQASRIDAVVPAAASDRTMSPDEMMSEIRARWAVFTNKLKQRVGDDNFDARSIGNAAWSLVDKRRKNPLNESDAELIEHLYAQLKRFNRLQSTKDEWLTYEVYATFITRLEQALSLL